MTRHTAAGKLRELLLAGCTPPALEALGYSRQAIAEARARMNHPTAATQEKLRDLLEAVAPERNTPQ